VLTQHKEYPALAPVAETDGMSSREIRNEQLRRRAGRFYFLDTLRKPTQAELEEAAHHHGDGDGNGHGNGNGHAIEGDGNGHHSITAGTTQNVVPNQ